ncbi:hypothetical protein T459_19377 [Capsicum annuum]|uniref:Protein WVD2-like 7 n=1 Tax=Capsicum annuum TaxID=4072 RepID=A0A2G2Z1W7_CAPAN|nr:hypothetical protein T459_19377 [Capsicum annuum]
MAGGIEEPFRLSFQADSWQSGSISFGRFENEALCWERRSSFTHNRYLEEVEKYFKPGSVTEKKVYFEELFRKRALLSQSSSNCQDGADSQASNDGSENTDYEGDFEHVNEIGHSACFVENHDRAATLLENGNSTHLSKNGKYQAENTGYDRDSERVNEVGDSARFEESFDGSNNGDIEVTEYTNSFDVLQSVPERLKAEAKFNLSAGNLSFNDLEITCFIQVSSGSKSNVLNQHKSSEEQPIARKVVASRASCTEKVSHRLYQSVNRKRNADCSFDLRCAMYRKRKKQRSNIYREISISKQLPCLPSTVNLTTAQKKPRYACYAANFLRALCCFNLIGLGDKITCFIQVSSGSKANVLNQHKSTEEQPISRKVVASRASCTEKVSHRLYQSVNRKRKKQRSNSYREISILKQLPYREPGRRSEKNKDGQSWEEAGARAAEADGGWTEREKF